MDTLVMVSCHTCHTTHRLDEDCPKGARNAYTLAQALTSRQSLPTDPQERKKAPMARGLLDYFPKALAEVARCSMIANEQHNPSEPMHWAREKSPDEADCIVRHLVDRGKIDSDGIRHSAKVAWRGLAMLERELDGEKV